MGYKLSKSKNIIDTLELEDGRILKVKANIGAIAHKFNAVYNTIIKCQKSEMTPSNAEKLGDSIIELMEITLGKENTDILIEYYEDDYVEMIEKIVPFIEGVFIPEIKKFVEEKQRVAKENYKHTQSKKMNRKQKRAAGIK